MIVLSSGLVGGASAYLTPTLEFPQSGYSISGEYETYYNSLPDPLLTVGLPISVEIITDPWTEESMQFFSRALLEKRLVNGEFEIRPVKLGAVLYPQSGMPETIPANAPCMVSNNLRICYAFMQFYESNGGKTSFGLPVSELENENGRLVQYFDYARFEWRPEILGETHVVVSDLGKMRLDQMGYNPNANQLNIPLEQLPKMEYRGPLKVLVFVDIPAILPGGKQTIFVVVQNNALQGLEGANITIGLTYADGSQQKLAPGTSDANGIYQTSFALPPNLIDEQIVQVQVNASSNSNSGTGQSWFRIRP